MLNEENNKNSTWGPAIQIFARVSAWIVAPLVVALIAGKSLDSHFNSKPMWFLILAGIGFLVSCFGIVRVIKDYISRMESAESRPESVGINISHLG